MADSAAHSFSGSFIRFSQKPKLRNPLMIVGLPGIGFVSKLAVDHLVRLLEAKPFATLYSPHFPNQVLALKSGRLRPFSMRFYYARLKKRDLVLVRGDLQPLTVEGQYEVSAHLLSFFQSLGGTDVLAMAGYAVNPAPKVPSIYGFSTSKQLWADLHHAGAKTTAVIVPIVGMAGLVPSLSKLYGLRGACLLVETPGNTVDAVGAKNLVGFLSKWLGEGFDVKALDSRAKKAQVLLKRIENQARQEETAAIAGKSPEALQKETQAYIR
ncbi:PAC2 family protein [Candidatus Micrarchaeota archaeon]|nr:PAC2 family protein [Candidatus Micrarchaeota archaeon]